MCLACALWLVLLQFGFRVCAFCTVQPVPGYECALSARECVCGL